MDYAGAGDVKMVAEHDWGKTTTFRRQREEPATVRDILLEVVRALVEKGYNPVNQLVGYLLSGDPAYITSHRNARSLIRRLERDQILEEIVKLYLTQTGVMVIKE
ncbi:IreB family regulatory phosphoprotein [Desulfothermobacter acidiphilus]|uniref:IreB family regulatory phosphoprotein n=1 Tax=Desulfothermobacter acidiphilus TaxID=1938353 RepID=UPI003F88DF4C